MNYYLDLKENFCKNFFKGEKNKQKAIENAYADMSRRAIGHKPQMKEVCVNWLVNEVFKESLSFKTQEEFDFWHKNTCEALIAKLGDFGTIGRAQKVINMSFKYLLCIDDTYRDILQYCHMTLDSYTLNWYKTIGGKLTIWSKIDSYDEYIKIQEDIRKYLNINKKYCIKIGNKTTELIDIPNVPFEAEFVIWEGEIIRARYGMLIKELNAYTNKGREKDGWLIGELFDEFLQSCYSKLTLE